MNLRKAETIQRFIFEFVIGVLRVRKSQSKEIALLPSLLNEHTIMSLNLTDLANPISPAKLELHILNGLLTKLGFLKDSGYGSA